MIRNPVLPHHGRSLLLINEARFESCYLHCHGYLTQYIDTALMHDSFALHVFGLYMSATNDGLLTSQLVAESLFAYLLSVILTCDIRTLCGYGVSKQEDFYQMCLRV